jgi:lipopolysaccharide export system permease protein
MSRKNAASTSPSEIAMADFARARTEQIAAIDQIEQVAAGRTALAILSGHMEQTVPAFTEWDRQAARQGQLRLNRIFMEPWRRWANGFSCLCFVLVGAPMAIRMRNADFLTSFFLCFLPILVVYYPVFMLGVSRVKAGVLPPPAVWMGNLLVTLWGLWLLRRVVRN